MTWINLGDPRPRESFRQYEPIQWNVGEILPLPASSAPLTQSFSEVLDARISSHQFGDVDIDQLGAFLWHSCRTRGMGKSDLGFDLEHRASPSAGAIHPIHIVVKRPRDNRWWLYRPQNHELSELMESDIKLVGLNALSQKVLNSDHATRILFLAEVGKTLSKYQNGCSLIWRDAGVLLAVMALTATAQGLNFCPLGITGEPWASNLADQGKLAGVGLALLGSDSGT